MAPVTVRSTANVAGGSGNTGWSARSLFSYVVPEIATDVVTPGNAPSFFGASSSSNGFAQAFTPGSSFSLAAIDVMIAPFGAVADSYYVEVQTDNSNKPSGTPVTNGTSTSYSGLTTPIVKRIDWPTPPSLSSGTKYWLVFKRSGALSDAAFYALRVSSASAYASNDSSALVGVTWTNSTTVDLAFAAYSTSPATYQYAVVQDANLHVFRSTDNGATWSEQDSSNAPAVNSATKPFSATLVDFGGILIQYFTGTNTVRERLFSLPSNTWASTDLQNADASTDADFNRNVRPIYSMPTGRAYGFYTSLADDADLAYVSRTTGAWAAAVNLLAVSDVDASSFLDAVESPRSSGFVSMFWQDISTDTVKVQTLTGTTQGTATNIDATGADTEAEHASAVYATNWDGTNTKVIVAFIDADGTLEERILTLGATAASITQATQHEVSSSTSYAGRQLATCVYGGDAYVFACTGTGIDYFKDTGIAGSWSAAYAWKAGLTNCYLSSVTPISGVGILVIYNDNGNVKVDLLRPGVAATVNGSLATGSGAANSGTHISKVAGHLATASGAAAIGTPHTGYSVAGSLAAASAASLTGVIAIDKNGALSTATGAALAGTKKAAKPGALAAATGAALAGTTAADIFGALATATGAALSGGKAIDIAGLIATAAAQSYPGSLATGTEVAGSLATATARANDGTTGIDTGDFRDRFRLFQLRTLPQAPETD